MRRVSRRGDLLIDIVYFDHWMMNVVLSAIPEITLMASMQTNNYNLHFTDVTGKVH